MKNYKTVTTFFAFYFILVGCGGGDYVAPERFSSCSQIKQYIDNVNNNAAKTNPVMLSSGTAANASEDISFTN